MSSLSSTSVPLRRESLHEESDAEDRAKKKREKAQESSSFYSSASALALFNYVAANDDELSFRAGAILTVISTVRKDRERKKEKD
jgi:hypothetical protein